MFTEHQKEILKVLVRKASESTNYMINNYQQGLKQKQLSEGTEKWAQSQIQKFKNDLEELKAISDKLEIKELPEPQLGENYESTTSG